MPRGRQRKGRRGREAVGEKEKERAVRQALRRERKAGAYLQPSDPDFRSFSNQLAAQGLRLQDVPGDGNCLFRALAQQLSDRLVTHQTLRRDIVHYMREHRDEFEPFLAEDESYDDYLSILSKDGEYAGNDVIVAFTRAFSIHVVIHQLNSPRWEITAPPTATSTSSERLTLHIAYLNGEHYCSVHPITHLQPLPQIKSPALTQESSSQEARDMGVTRATGRERRVEGEQGGRDSELQRVVAATGCQDLVLAEQVLSEAAYDVDLAVVELLQLMELSQSGQVEVSDGLTTVASEATDSSLSPTVTQSDTDSIPRTKKTCQPLPKKAGRLPAEPQRHLSNRERKAQAKADRKERRREQHRGGDKVTDEFDPVGAMAV